MSSNDIKIGFNNIQISENTVAKRGKIKPLLDKYCTFMWRGYNSFDNFGAFIINDKNSLKFYNGPSYSNEYSNPQFSNASGNLLGISFKTQVVSFTIAVYWISENHYRQLLNWLNPYEINYLTFSFEPECSYLVKLSGISDSERRVIGREDGKDMYYSELTLNFEVQGEQVAHYSTIYEWKEWEKNNTNYITSLKTDIVQKKTDIATPLIFNFAFNFLNSENTLSVFDTLSLSLKAEYNVDGTVVSNIDLFSVVMKNFSLLDENNVSDNYISTKINISYNSETGMLFLQFAGGTYNILNLLTTTAEGRRFVQDFSSNKFKIPGLFDFPDFNMNNIVFKLEVMTDNAINLSILDSSLCNIQCYGRTNLI